MTKASRRQDGALWVGRVSGVELALSGLQLVVRPPAHAVHILREQLRGAELWPGLERLHLQPVERVPLAVPPLHREPLLLAPDRPTRLVNLEPELFAQLASQGRRIRLARVDASARARPQALRQRLRGPEDE